MKLLFMKKKLLQSASVFILFLLLQGCAAGGRDAGKHAPHLTDPVLKGQDNFGNEISLLDQKVIRDTITFEDKENIAGRSLDWLNPDTGNRGVISVLSEIRENEKTCRVFETTHESFGGVMLFSGKSCKVSDDIWIITDFKSL